MNDAHDPGHGSSPAAWTAITIMLLAITIGAVFFWLDQPAFVIGSVAGIALGPIVGSLMARAGYGVNGPKTKASH